MPISSNLWRRLAPIFGLVLFGLALWVLFHALKGYAYHDVIGHLRSLPPRRLGLALLLVLGNYLVLTGYDALAFRYIRHPLPYQRIALTSFIGYAFSHNIGLTILTNGSVRYRFYSEWGLSAVDIAKIILFCGFSFWLGFFTVGGFVFLWEPFTLPAGFPLPIGAIHWFGGGLLAATAAYLVSCAGLRKSLRVRNWEFQLPSFGVSLAQVGLACLDWLTVASALYALLPPAPGLSYLTFIGLFLVAQLAGFVSQVPGGLGVFETVSLLLLQSYYPAAVVLGMLLAFRGLYYLLPLGVALVLLAAHEFLERQRHIRRIARLFGKWVPSLVPNVLSVTTFVGGAVLLFSAATPAVAARLAWLQPLLPLPVVEGSHFVGSVAGICLLLLAQGLQRRLDAAYVLSAVCLGVGIVVSLLMGFNYEGALALALMLAALLPARAHFYRTSSFVGQRFTAGWLAAIGVVLLTSVWLGVFAYKHVQYTPALWWQFTLAGDAPRFLRATFGGLAVLLVFALYHLLRPLPAPALAPSAGAWAHARDIVAVARQTYAHLAGLGDKSFLFNPQGDTLLMYRISGRSWVAVGDPLGPKPEAAELIWRFRELCDRYDGWPVFFQVGTRHLPIYLDLGLTLLKIGEEAHVPLPGFAPAGLGAMGGFDFEVLPATAVPGHLEEAREVSEAWLAQRPDGERTFIRGHFDPAYLRNHPMARVRQGGKVWAFATVWLGAEGYEAAADLVRVRPDAPAGVLDFLLVELMSWAKREGYHWFNCGLMPVSNGEAFRSTPLGDPLYHLLDRQGTVYGAGQDARHSLAPFAPVWEPRYLASPGGMTLPRVLMNLTELVVRGPNP